METRTTRSKFTIPFVALGAFLLGGVSVLGCVAARYQESPSRAKVLADIRDIRNALDAYAMLNAGIYPDSLRKLVTNDVNGHRFLHQTTVPRDPWDREYVYVQGAWPSVITYGRDGVPGGTGDDADIDYASIVNGG